MVFFLAKKAGSELRCPKVNIQSFMHASDVALEIAEYELCTYVRINKFPLQVLHCLHLLTVYYGAKVDQTKRLAITTGGAEFRTGGEIQILGAEGVPNP